VESLAKTDKARQAENGESGVPLAFVALPRWFGACPVTLAGKD